MTPLEKRCIEVADKYKGHVSDIEKVKWLSTEVVELGVAIASKDEKDIIEELGDCLFLLLHIFSRHNPNDLSTIDLMTHAAFKMAARNKQTNGK